MNKAKSKRFGEAFVQQVGGQLRECNVSFSAGRRARFMALLSYDGMNISAYFDPTFTFMMIKNFKFIDDVNFSINEKLDTLGLSEPVEKAFREYAVPVFTNSGYSLSGLQRFCSQLSNEADIRHLGLLPGEFLAISASQIILQTQNSNVDLLEERLALLSSLFHRNKVLLM